VLFSALEYSLKIVGMSRDGFTHRPWP